MEFEIDVSGEDILNKDYTICIANKDSIIKGFKMPREHAQILQSNFSDGLYRYKKSKKDRANFKVRIYSVIIYYLFKSIRVPKNIHLTICRDFAGKENDIKSNLKYLLNLRKINIMNIRYTKLDKGSAAHEYSYLMRKDIKNKMTTYVNIKVPHIEKFLKK